MSKVLSTRIDEDIALRLENASKKSHLDKTSLIKIVLLKGLEEMEEAEAIKGYVDGEISLGKLADLLNITKWDAIDLLIKEKIALNYGKEDFLEDLQAL